MVFQKGCNNNYHFKNLYLNYFNITVLKIVIVYSLNCEDGFFIDENTQICHQKLQQLTKINSLSSFYPVYFQSFEIY